MSVGHSWPFLTLFLSNAARFFTHPDTEFSRNLARTRPTFRAGFWLFFLLRPSWSLGRAPRSPGTAGDAPSRQKICSEFRDWILLSNDCRYLHWFYRVILFFNKSVAHAAYGSRSESRDDLPGCFFDLCWNCYSSFEVESVQMLSRGFRSNSMPRSLSLERKAGQVAITSPVPITGESEPDRAKISAFFPKPANRGMNRNLLRYFSGKHGCADWRTESIIAPTAHPRYPVQLHFIRRN